MSRLAPRSVYVSSTYGCLILLCISDPYMSFWVLHFSFVCVFLLGFSVVWKHKHFWENLECVYNKILVSPNSVYACLSARKHVRAACYFLQNPERAEINPPIAYSTANSYLFVHESPLLIFDLREDLGRSLIYAKSRWINFHYRSSFPKPVYCLNSIRSFHCKKMINNHEQFICSSGTNELGNPE